MKSASKRRNHTKLGVALAAVAFLGALGMALAQSPTHLVLSIGPRGFGQATPVLIDKCEKEVGNISVTWDKISDVPNESRSIYVTDFTSHSPTPDVLAVDVIWPGDFAARGWLAPIDPYVSQSDLSQFAQGFLAAAQLNGKTYGFPLYTDGIHLFYRKDLLDKYGLKPPQTWEELIQDSQTILKGENDPNLVGFVSMWSKIEGLFMNWLAFFSGDGGHFFDANGNLAIDSQAGVTSLQTMVDMLYKEKIAPQSILTFKPDDARILFQQGRAVFLMVQDFVLPPLTAADSPVKDKVDFKRVPYFQGHPDAGTTVVGGFFLTINNYSKHKAEAAALAKCMTSQSSQVQAALLESKVPTRPAVYDNPQVKEQQPLVAKLGQDFKYSVARPSAETGTNYQQVSEIMQTEITAALLQKKTPEQALKDATSQINAIIK